MTPTLCPCGRPIATGATWCGDAGFPVRRFAYRVVHAYGKVCKGEVRVCDVDRVFPGMWFGHVDKAFAFGRDPRACALILATGQRPSIHGVTASEVSVTEVLSRPTREDDA